MYIGRVNCLKASKGIWPLKMKTGINRKKRYKADEHRIKRNFRKWRFTQRLFNLSIKLFMWAMRREKRKYPIYWIGQDHKLFKYSTWLTVLGCCLAKELKINLQAACYVSMIDKKVTCGKLEFISMHNLFYEELCLHGADIFRKEAKLRGEKPAIKKGDNNADAE